MMKYIALSCLVLSACSRYDISISEQKVDRDYLASTHVGTPDPRQLNPPLGQMLSVEWRVPNSVVESEAELVLHLIYKNYTEKTIPYPVNRRFGNITYFLLDEEFEETCGLLTYRADIILPSGEVFKEWKHQLWVNLIHVNDD